MEPVNPVGNVQCPVGAHRDEVLRREEVDLAGLVDHPHLRHHAHRLQVDGKGPGDLHDGEVVIIAKSKSHAWDKKNFDPVKLF